ncbi:MAG: type II toxin-antitoxin system VapC family toxin [Deltaproteobacteria bacterium]|nr:type II toxin-antitoxin system VapC family toxin [Deltaproteobacteria bacterium]
MNVQYVLDTNTVSAAFWPEPPDGLIERLKASVGTAALPVPVWHELRYGCALLESGSGKRVALERFLHSVVLPHYPLLDYDRPAAEWHARERARLRKAGKTPPFIDGQIAAVAAIRGATLVTRNLSDFEHFQDLEIESWVPAP